MNEQERLQRVIDILASRMDDIFVGEYYAIRTDKIIEAAKEITVIFKQPQKDTRSRRERKLDEQFAAMGVKPRVYHFSDIEDFKAVTVAQIPWRGQEGWGSYNIFSYQDIRILIQKCEYNRRREQYPSVNLLTAFRNRGVYGIAICDKHNPVKKRTGRMKAKGRLMQHLLKEAQEK